MDLKSINAQLRREFGTVPGDDTRPLFKIVHASNEMELRIGKFSEWYGSIFVREVSGAHRVHKYQAVRNCFVLERWFPGWTPELPETLNKGGYEGIYFFIDKYSNPLPLRWDVAKLVAKTSLQRSGGIFGDDRREGHITAATFDQQDKETFDREVAYFEQVFENPAPHLSHGGGVVVPHNFGD